MWLRRATGGETDLAQTYGNIVGATIRRPRIRRMRSRGARRNDKKRGAFCTSFFCGEYGGTKPCPTLTNGNLVGDDAHLQGGGKTAGFDGGILSHRARRIENGRQIAAPTALYGFPRRERPQVPFRDANRTGVHGGTPLRQSMRSRRGRVSRPVFHKSAAPRHRPTKNTCVSVLREGVPPFKR